MICEIASPRDSSQARRPLSAPWVREGERTTKLAQLLVASVSDERRDARRHPGDSRLEACQRLLPLVQLVAVVVSLSAKRYTRSSRQTSQISDA